MTVHNAVEPNDKPKSEYERSGLDAKVVTFLGRITYQKGPEYFIEAAYKIHQVDPSIHFVMAGTGDMLEKMIRRVAQLGMGSHFHFTGFLKGEAVDQMFAMTDVFVMPSISEPFGIVPLEAMRLNVPVVISKQSGVSEVVKHALRSTSGISTAWPTPSTASAITSPWPTASRTKARTRWTASNGNWPRRRSRRFMNR